MIEKKADLFDLYWHRCNENREGAICITTNGFVSGDSKPRAIMGRGVAQQALVRISTKIQYILGENLREYGNRVHRVWLRVFSFPVKPVSALCDGTNVVSHLKRRYRVGQSVPGYACKASLEIIARSLEQLEKMRLEPIYIQSSQSLRIVEVNPIYLPRPGCGAGGLDWEDVRPLCEQYGDWLVVVHWP